MIWEKFYVEMPGVSGDPRCPFLGGAHDMGPFKNYVTPICGMG